MISSPIKRFIIAVFVFNVIAASMIYLFTKPPKRIYPYNIPLEATLSISPETIRVTGETAAEKPLNTARLTFTLTNNTDFTLNNVKIIIPSIGLDLLETVGARRDTNLPWKSSDSVFSVGSILPDKTKIATVSALSSIPNTYLFRTWITTKEGITTTTNQETLRIE